MLKWIRKLFAPKPNPKRAGFCVVSWAEAEKLLKEGWTIAPEEDRNRTLGVVYLERIETKAGASHG